MARVRRLTYEQATELVAQAVERLGASYDKLGSAGYRCVPAWSDFHAAVLTVAESLGDDDA